MPLKSAISTADLLLDTKKSRAIQNAMSRELERAKKGLHVRGHPRPFFVSYLLRATRGFDVWGRYGSVFSSQPIDDVDLYTECRVGSRGFDQTIDGGLNADLASRESWRWTRGPRDLAPEAVRYSFWKLSQLKYWEAVQEYYEKKKVLVDQKLKHSGPSFSKEKPLLLNESIEPPKFPIKRWEEFVRETSAEFCDYRELADPHVSITGSSRVRIFVSSEGTRFVVQESYYHCSVTAYYLTEDGVWLSSSRHFHGRLHEDLPTVKKIRDAVAWVAADLKSLAKSRPMEPYAGPALLAGRGTGLLFHEAIGHRLEGERMTARTEGQTFAGKIGERILPEGVDVLDDPSLERWEKTPLFGSYRVDDEGVASRPVKLVDDGVLKSFLMSRASVPGFSRSNGHGRAERHQDPMGRMATLIVKARDMLPWETLKEMLAAEVERRKLRFGIIIKNVSNGETRTDPYDFQAFKGVPNEVYTLDSSTGEELRVRDVSFIGTPLAAIQRIRAFGGDYEVDNSYCVAESGVVPVSSIAPAMLVDELELQRSTSHYFRRPTLPLPPMAKKR